MKMNWKGFGRKGPWPNFKVLSPGGPEEKYENLSQDSRLPGPRSEPGTSRIRSRSVNHSTTMFCYILVKICNLLREFICKKK
jgi:hypothetical protein